MLISTLREVVRALGGELRLSAVFPDIVVDIKHWVAVGSQGWTEALPDQSNLKAVAGSILMALQQRKG